MQALYAFARISDDISDQFQAADLRREQLLAWRMRVMRLEDPTWLPTTAGASSIAAYDQLWPALADTVNRYAIPIEYLRQIVDGVMLDLDHHQPADWSALEHYCYHVASAVGLACTRIWQADSAMPAQPAIECGYAFQLTNILRDLHRDAKIGRIYVPLSEMEKYGVDPKSWLAGSPDGDWRAMIQAIAVRTEGYYCSSWQTIDFLPPSSRRMFSLMWRSYRALLSEVLRKMESLPNDQPVRIPVTTKARLAAQHFISPLYWTLSCPIP